MTTKQEKTYNNFTMMLALEQVDEEKAIQVVSNPNLNPRELSDLLECCLLGKVVNKNTGKPTKLSNNVMMAGLISKINQLTNSETQEHM